MKKLEWKTPTIIKYERNNVDILGLKPNLGAELGATTGPS